MKLAKLSLLLVVLLDVMGQGLVFPIVNTLVLDPSQGMLAHDTPISTRQLYYGIAIGAFFLAWFLGAAYISKISDFVGRKEGILFCLSGALAGYVLTIIALYVDSFALLVLGRIISGFTAGNQPIAQAALVDLSADEADKTRNMGFLVMALSLGLMVGPLLGGLLSDKAVLGDLASLELPFFVASALVLINIAMIVGFFHNQPFERRPFKIKPSEVFLNLWQVTQRPVVLRISLVFFFAQLGLNSFYIFLDTYLTRRFDFDTLENSIALLIFGLSMAFASAFLVAPLTKRYSKIKIVFVTIAVMIVDVAVFAWNGSPWIGYLLIVPCVVAFAVYYPTMLTLFSAAVDETEQGWVMGVTIALYTLGSGLISLIGGELMALDIRMPFFISIAANGLALLLIVTLWRSAAITSLDRR